MAKVQVFAKLDSVEYKLALSEKMMKKPLVDAVIKPFLVGYNKKAAQCRKVVALAAYWPTEDIEIEDLTRVTINGERLRQDQLRTPTQTLFMQMCPGATDGFRVIMDIDEEEEPNLPQYLKPNIERGMVGGEASQRNRDREWRKDQDSFRAPTQGDVDSYHGWRAATAGEKRAAHLEDDDAQRVYQLAVKARIAPGDFQATFEGAHDDGIDADAVEGEKLKPPEGWSVALNRLWGHIMRADMADGPPDDPLTPLTARLLLTAAQPDAEMEKPPTITKHALVRLLNTPEALQAACKALTAGVREEIRMRGRLISKSALARLDEMVNKGTTLALLAVRRMHAMAGVPLRVWDYKPSAEDVEKGVLTLDPSTPKEEFWERAVKPHVPCYIEGGAQYLLPLFEPDNFGKKFGRDAMPVRRKYETDADGRRVFAVNARDEVCAIPNQKRTTKEMMANLVFLAKWYRAADNLGQPDLDGPDLADPGIDDDDGDDEGGGRPKMTEEEEQAEKQRRRLAEGEEERFMTVLLSEKPKPAVEYLGLPDEYTREMYFAKIALRLWSPALETEMMGRDDTPYARFKSCVGPLNSDGLFMYIGAGHNASAIHCDPAEGFVLVCRGVKKYMLWAPAEAENLYPCPAPRYHTSAVPPFTDPSVGLGPHPSYAKTRPYEVVLCPGDSLYIPAHWWYCECGGGGLNVSIHWWCSVHPNKRDDAPEGMPHDDEIDFSKGLQGCDDVVDVIEEGVFMQGV